MLKQTLKQQYSALVRPQLFALRLVVFGLYVGVSTLAVASFLIGREIVIARQMSPITAVGLLGGLALVLLAVVLPRILVRRAAEEVSRNAMIEADAVSALSQIHARRTVLGIALLEGGALLNVLCFVSQKHAFSLAAAMFLAACVWSMWPTRSRVFRWVAARMPQSGRTVPVPVRPVEKLRKSA